jgi:hypothetical protein
MSRITLVLALIALVSFSSGCGDNAPAITASDAAEAIDSATDLARTGLPGRGTVLRLFGDVEGYAGTVPDIDGDEIDDPATCFDLDILDVTGRKIGTATDCLSDINGVGDGLALVGTTIFRLANGTFISRGSTTVQPVTTDEPTPITHTTGAIPMAGANGVISGSGAYAGLRAQVRLSGAVNLSRLASEGRIAFDCLFAVNPL